MLGFLFKNRFELFISTQLLILFGSLFFPVEFFENRMLPTLFLLNIIAGVILLSEKKLLSRLLLILFAISVIAFGVTISSKKNEMGGAALVRLVAFFVFHLIVAYHIILQVWKARKVNKKVIIGLMSGYISLGFLAFFLFITIEILQPGSFKGDLLSAASIEMRGDALMYHAFITLLTIGYGDISPATSLAQKAAMLVALAGQFYMVIITAIVVGKFLIQSNWGKQA